MNVRKIFLSLCMLIIASTTLFAQQMNPAKWKKSPFISKGSFTIISLTY